MNMFGKTVVACVFACVAIAARADFVVVDNGRPVAVVCVVGNASSAAQFAAKEITKYVEAMTGAKLKIVVGRTVGGARIEIDDAVKGLEREEFRIETKSGVLSLSGGSPRAALYAAYELLPSSLPGRCSQSRLFRGGRCTASMATRYRGNQSSG